jgi:hypothetical protein
MKNQNNKFKISQISIFLCNSFIFLLFYCCISHYAFAGTADSLKTEIKKYRTKGGGEYIGKIINQDDRVLLLELSNGDRISIFKKEIEDISIPSYNEIQSNSSNNKTGITRLILWVNDDIDDIDGKILAIDSTEFQVLLKSGQVIKLPKKLVKEYQEMKTSFVSYGFVLGTPAGINLSFGYQSNRFGFRVSGFYLPTVSGIQGNYFFELSRSSSFASFISLCLVASKIDNKENPYWGNSYSKISSWEGYGINLGMNWGGFFLELGSTWGSGSYSSPQLALQLGYIYENKWLKTKYYNY